MLRPGDLFEIVLVQIKGGTAPWPTPADVKRLRAVQRRYRAKAVVLASWQKGAEPAFYLLKRSSAQGRNPWRSTSPVEVFGVRRPSSRQFLGIRTGRAVGRRDSWTPPSDGIRGKCRHFGRDPKATHVRRKICPKALNSMRRPFLFANTSSRSPIGTPNP